MATPLQLYVEPRVHRIKVLGAAAYTALLAYQIPVVGSNPGDAHVVVDILDNISDTIEEIKDYIDALP